MHDFNNNYSVWISPLHQRHVFPVFSRQLYLHLQRSSQRNLRSYRRNQLYLFRERQRAVQDRLDLDTVLHQVHRNPLGERREVLRYDRDHPLQQEQPVVQPGADQYGVAVRGGLPQRISSGLRDRRNSRTPGRRQLDQIPEHRPRGRFHLDQRTS